MSSTERNLTHHEFSFAHGGNTDYLDSLYHQYLENPQSVDESWQKFFSGMDFAIRSGRLDSGSQGSGDSTSAKVEAFINAFRRLGHLSSHLNPLAEKPPIKDSVQPESHGLKDVNPSQEFHPANLPGNKSWTFQEIHSLLLDTYCRTIGADFREMNDIDMVVWLQEKMEGCRNKPSLSREMKLRIHQKLTEAEGFERFLQDRFLGQKRFSLEGAESFIPMLDILLEEGANLGVEEAIIGMAHRGRLNTLANILRKPYAHILQEFEGSEIKVFDIDGDVKYHQGYANEVATVSGKKVRLYLSPNPSHLEAVNPIVEGFARSRQHVLQDLDRKKILPIQIHGDAAFIGQGLVAETLNLAYLDHYTTGGTIHIIINNQIGFTTNPKDSCSCDYNSDIAKMIRAPVLHVNADDPEAVVWVMQLAMQYRQKFQRDFVIDLVGYRRHGHNETDEPQFTQPLMYKKIKDQETVWSLYAKQLERENILSSEESKIKMQEFRGIMQNDLDFVRQKGFKATLDHVPESLKTCFVHEKVSHQEQWNEVKTALDKKIMLEVGEKICHFAEGFHPHPKIVRLYETRRASFQDQGKIDWPLAELLAFGTLAKEGFHIRLSGQDCQRGTFSSRHGVLVDFENGSKLELLNQIQTGQGLVEIINSPLSEQGVLGFEFGYSVANRHALVMWEGQFGDFCNGAQIIIDQFISASEAKWKQMCGLVMLLPHGYEGQGPEHSSARLERFLQLCGNYNIQVTNLTTAAQYFHALRRQMHRHFRKPLINMSPKSLLRLADVACGMEEVTSGKFQEILGESSLHNKSDIEKIIFCSGKIFYDLMMERSKGSYPVFKPIIRLEQFYPFPGTMIKNHLQQYPKLKEVVWVQEEPANMGAWTFVQPRLKNILQQLNIELKYEGRNSAGTTAEGSLKAHVKEQQRIVQSALGDTQSRNVFEE